MSLRRKILHRAFEALYGPLVFLHEPAGRCLFGPAWNGRRREIARRVDSSGLVLDVGCGSGHLLAELRRRGIACVGIDRSKGMISRASPAELHVVLGDVRRIPVLDSRVAVVVCTYPGPWIHDPCAWSELWRVTATGSSVAILVGGTITRGRFSLVRRTLGRLAYGGDDLTDVVNSLHGLGEPYFRGTAKVADDRWGQALVWEGKRRVS